MERKNTNSQGRKTPNKTVLLFIFIAVTGGFGWMASRPIPAQTDFQKVTGFISSATAVTKQGQNEFTVRIWLKDRPHVAYKLAAKLSGEILGEHKIAPGRAVEMEALTSEIKEPFTGFLHNVEPSIEIASLSVDGHPISSREDYIQFEQKQKRTATWIAIATGVLGLFVITMTGKQQQ